MERSTNPLGKVYLVGAGPGDPDLLTVKAARLLGDCDVVVYDRLVSAPILALIPAGTTRLFAGKIARGQHMPQAEINDHLVRLARAGHRVVRLKGGDPFVFGRGGEEALALVAAGIPFRLVPGITAGIGGLAYAGIPATHRDVNAAVTFVTGHQAGGNVPEHLDWAALAKGSPVLVIYMAVQNLPAIVGKLLAAGRSAAEPMAIISKASTPDQTVLETTLGSCVTDCAAANPPPPAMVVIGRVVELRASLDWLGALPAPQGLGRKLATDPFNKAPINPA